MSISDFLGLMPDSVSYRQVSSRDGEGNPTYGTATTYRARVVYKEIRTANQATGQDQIGAGEVWFAGVFYPNVDDELTLPDGTKPNIINWAVFTDQLGPHHTRVIFGGTQSGGQRAAQQ